jgi:hypothetical protein
MKRGFEPKTALTPQEILQAAYLHEFMGVDVQTLTVIYRVNPGRIAEAIRLIRSAVGMSEPGDAE